MPLYSHDIVECSDLGYHVSVEGGVVMPGQGGGGGNAMNDSVRLPFVKPHNQIPCNDVSPISPYLENGNMCSFIEYKHCINIV